MCSWRGWCQVVPNLHWVFQPLNAQRPSWQVSNGVEIFAHQFQTSGSPPAMSDSRFFLLPQVKIRRTAVSNPPLILSVHVDRTSKHLNQTSTINSHYLFLYSRKNNWNIQYCLLRISDQMSILISTHREFHNCPFYSVVAVLSADGLVGIVFTFWVCECLCMCPRGKIRHVIQHELQQRGFWCLYNCLGTDDTTVPAQKEQIKKLYSYVVQMKMECQIQQQLVVAFMRKHVWYGLRSHI